MDKAELDRLNRMYAEFEKLLVHIPTRYPTMVNFFPEMHRCLERYSRTGLLPTVRFEYRQLSCTEDMRSRICSLADQVGTGSGAAERLREIVLGSIDEISILDTIGDLPSGVICAAREILLSPQQSRSDGANGADPLDSADTSRAFQAILEILGLQWAVQINSGQASRIAVNSRLRRIRLRADDTFTRTEILRLSVHEIGTHVLRAEVGAQQPLHQLRIGRPGYLAVEEGLAVRQEEDFGYLSSDLLRRYAGRAFAVALATETGFTSVFSQLVEVGVSPVEAFEMTARAKHGLHDLESPGANRRPMNYLEGFFSLKEKWPSRLDDRLFVGKVDQRDFELIDDLRSGGLLTFPEITAADCLIATRLVLERDEV